MKGKMTLEERIKKIEDLTQFAKKQQDCEVALHFTEESNKHALLAIKELQNKNKELETKLNEVK